YRALVEARWDDVPAPRPAVTADHPVRPNGLYAATKVFGEALARDYADSHALSMICLRIGRVLPGDKPRDPREAAVYLSHRDAVQAIERCIDAPDDLRFAILFAVSANRGGYRDLEAARRLIGYVPQDGADWPL
ncbi:MAG: NAD-dependent epimerase/dehydratase family protein, partial [Spirochaetaceae bacterium]|nr:NAD-dependent epimerase/dehydratase family protein [Spirochaetaceae bacterium]